VSQYECGVNVGERSERAVVKLKRRGGEGVKNVREDYNATVQSGTY
jgi:hypothetical protein